MKPRSPEKSVGVADAKCWSSMRKWQRCTFLHSMRSSLSLLRNKLLLQGSRLKTVFFEQDTETRTHLQGMACFSTCFQGLPSCFLCTSRLSFFHLSLRSPCFASYCPVCVHRSCRTENRCEGVPTQAFVALGRYGYTYSPSSPTQTPGTMQRPLAPIRGAEGEMAMSAPPRCLLWRHTSDTFPSSLCSDSPVSSRPQPLGSVGDDAPCEDTREDFWTVRLTSRHHVLQGGF